jgi:hypothetical protein
MATCWDEVTDKGLTVTKLFTPQMASNAHPEHSTVTPVQFLPSTMLSWRTPIMARSGLPATAGRKTRFLEAAIARQPKASQPAP